MPKRATPVQLGEEERAALVQVTKRHKSEQQLVLRARIVLAADEGRSNAEIARLLSVSVETVRLWRDRWLALQAVALSDLSVTERLSDSPRSGRPSEIGAEQVCRLKALACEQPKERPISQWTGREIADEVMARGILKQISPRHAARLLKKGISSRI
jgi:putative transposase